MSRTKVRMLILEERQLFLKLILEKLTKWCPTKIAATDHNIKKINSYFIKAVKYQPIVMAEFQKQYKSSYDREINCKLSQQMKSIPNKQDSDFMVDFMKVKHTAYQFECSFYYLQGLKDGVKIFDHTIELLHSIFNFDTLQMLITADHIFGELNDMLYNKYHHMDQVNFFMNNAERILKKYKISDDVQEKILSYWSDTLTLADETEILYNIGLKNGYKIAKEILGKAVLKSVV